MGDSSYAIARAAELIGMADALLIGAGAGMGVDSGLPDFRGNEGFWKAYPPFAKLNRSFVEMANPRWFDTEPATAWGFYGHRRNLYRQTMPHAGFEILRNWGSKMPGGCFVFTSNVDGHFQKAGFDPAQVFECHGSIRHEQCSLPCSEVIWDAPDEDLDIDSETFQAREPLPRCPECGELARPNVLMFGDRRWNEARAESQQVRYHEWLAQIGNLRLVIVECGAGQAVPTVRFESETQPGKLIRINVRESQVPAGNVGLPLPALSALQQLDAAIQWRAG